MNTQAQSAPADCSKTGTALIKDVGFFNIVAEDFRAHQKQISSPGFWALFAYRWGCLAQGLRPRPLKWLFLIPYVLMQRTVRNLFGIELERSVFVGRRLRLGHQHCLVIHKHATIGDDVLIRHSVTLGRGAEWVPGVGPILGNRVEISPGVVIIGNVRIGNDVSIGPNCVVSQDVPDNRTLFVANPRVFPKSDNSEGV